MRTRASGVAMVLAVMVGLIGSACSGSSDDATPAVPSLPVVPTSDGDSCEDPVGDLSVDASAESGSGIDPAGIDIVTASAQANEDAVDVRFTTAGPIDVVPSPVFVVAQGNPFDPLSFEVRAVRDDQTGVWTTTLITWEQAENRRSIVAQPVVDGSSIAWSLPSADLPPLAVVMIFGATGHDAVGVVVFDDCSALTTASTVG